MHWRHRESIMRKNQWKDPIVAEVRKIRKSFDEELKKNPQGFMDKAVKDAIKAGFKISTLKPAKHNIQNEKRRKANYK